MVCTNIKSAKDYSEWHERVDHIYKERYRELYNKREDIPHFPSTVLESYTCVPHVMAKVQKTHIQKIYKKLSPRNELHFGISGPFTTSLGKNSYIAHLIEPWSAFLAVFFLNTKDELADVTVTRRFINKIENSY